MNTSVELLLAIFTGGIIGSGTFLIYQFLFNRGREKKLEKEATRVLNKARAEANRIEKKAEIKVKDWTLKMRRKAEEEREQERKKLEIEKENLQLRQSRQEDDFLKQTTLLEEQKKDLELEQKDIHLKSKELEKFILQQKDSTEQLTRQLEKVSQMTREEASSELKKILQEETRIKLIPQLKEIEDRLKKESQSRAKNILAQAIARQASASTSEQTTTHLAISGDDVKGKIIGREGRNIRALEQACGVDVLIEEGQDAIVLSCFDSVRREIAKTSIVRLVKDGRVHPARIEEVAAKVKSEIFQSMKSTGEEVCFELGIHNVHPELIQTLGGLKFKTLRGQNALEFSKKLAELAGAIMAEIGGDEKKAKRAALFHCIGLNVDHRVEGHYAQAGSLLAEKCREKSDIVQAILCHNSKEEAVSVLDHVIQSAFNLYQSLSSLKTSNIESFISRMKNIESIANSFSGVIRSFALRSGKEIRVLVDSSQVTDAQSLMLCSDIAQKLERELDHSYQIKVSLIRESRIIEHAK